MGSTKNQIQGNLSKSDFRSSTQHDLRKEVPFQKNKTLSFEPKLHLGV